MLQRAILEATAPGGAFTRRGLSMLASDRKNPDLVRDIFRVDKRMPKFESVAGIAKALGRDVNDFLVNTIPSNARERLAVRGTVGAGIWREQTEWPPEDHYEIEVSPAPISGARHGVEVEGRSMDRVFPPGTILDVVLLIGSNVSIQTGDYVIVERRKGDLVETTCKRVHRRDDGEWELHAESTLPEFADPIRIGKPDNGILSDDGICVQAIVIWAHRPMFNRRAG